MDINYVRKLLKKTLKCWNRTFFKKYTNAEGVKLGLLLSYKQYASILYPVVNTNIKQKTKLDLSFMILGFQFRLSIS